jgi:hypothetical protein
VERGTASGYTPLQQRVVTPSAPVRESVAGRPSYVRPWRALALGVVGVVALCAATPYNNFKLKNTFLYGNHLPIGALFAFFALLFVVNPLLRRHRPQLALLPGELLLIWAMWTVGGGLAGPALWRTLGPVVVVPAYFAGAGRPWLRLFADSPDWLLLSRDAQSRAVLAFYHGLAPGEAIPWAAWTPIVVAWGLQFACVMAFSLGVCALFRRQWQERERLTFPLAQLTVMLVSDSHSRTRLTSNRLFWAGAGVVIVHHTLSTLHAYFPTVPELPREWDALAWQQTSPWSALGIWYLGLYFAAVGAVYLIPVEVSFSLWFTYLGFHGLRVLRRAYGYEPLMPGPLDHERAAGLGAFIVWACWLLWVARPQWRRVWRAALRPGSVDERAEAISARWALLLSAGGFAGMLVWMSAAGVPPAFGVPFIGLFAIILLILTRIMAETGMLFLFPPFDMSEAMAAAGYTGYTPGAAGTLLMTEQVYADYREAPMPAITNAFALGGAGQINPRVFGGAAALALLVGYFVGFWAFVWVSYRYGSVTLDPWGTEGAPAYRFDRAVRFVESYGLPDAGALVAVGTGGVLAALLAVLRLRFLWWPLGPVGLTLASTYAMDCFWFSVLAGWLCKVITLRLGGLAGYRAALPFFIGLIIGEALFAGVSIFWSMLAGVSTPQFLPG